MSQVTDTRAPYTTKPTKRMLVVGKCTGGKTQITVADADWLKRRYTELILNAPGATPDDIKRWIAAIKQLERESRSVRADEQFLRGSR